MPREAVTINHACERAEVSRRTMYTWIKNHKVEYTRTPSGRVRIFTDSLFQDPAPPVTLPAVE